MSCSLMGANARMCIAFESAWGTKASGTYTQVPFLSYDMAAVDAVSDDAVLGYGRDAQRPQRDGVTVRGRVVVIGDQTAVGYWLKLCFGAAADTGTTPDFSHLWASGLAALPSMTIEVQHPDGTTPQFTTHRGVVADSVSITWGPTGRPRLEIGLIAVDEEEDNVSDAGTPNVISPRWFDGKTSVLTKDGTALAKITALTFNLSNNWDAVPTIGSGGLISCADPGMFAAGGSLTARYNDLVLYNIAKGATLFDISAGWAVDATHSLLIEIDQAELTRQGKAITNAGAIQRTYNIIGSKDATEGQAVHVTLANQTPAY